MSPSDRALSKFLSLILRHRPGVVGLSLDAAGWVGVDDLLAGLRRQDRWSEVTLSDVERVVADNPKQRFELADGRIRARQGHSVPVDLGLEALAPPARLFHGTVARVLPAIRREGLRKMRRHHVHLSADVATATQVGGRRGAPVVLTVRAGAMAAAGHVFYRSGNGVWLTKHVPPEFIEGP